MIETQEDDNLFPRQRHNRAGLTPEEIQNILHFADERGIHGAARIKLLKYFRDLRAARAVQKRQS